jgi:RimJ/RimL family protein N-acetyltransferase
MARSPNLDAELTALQQARGGRGSSPRRVINHALRSLSHRARGFVLPAVPLPDPPLSDGVVVLRPLSRHDAGAITHACQDAEISRWTSVPPVYRERDARQFVSAAERDRKAGRAVSLAVIPGDGGMFTGSVTLTCDWEHRKGEIGCWITAEARRQSFGTRAVRLIAGWALDELGLERVELLLNPENEASRRLALRAGFTSEGLLRAYRPRNGDREDFMMFSRLPTDPCD